MENIPGPATKVNFEAPPPDLPPGSTATVLVEVIREVTRNIMGLGIVGGGYWMFYKFVVMASDKDKVQIILLIIGYLGGFLSGAMTWYFGGAMRSALAALQQQAKGGTQ
jgi:hypothetical protein